MIRRSRVLGAVLSMTLLAACGRPPSATSATPLPRIPRDAPRFEIDSVTDSTAIIRTWEARWVRRGAVAYAVDPLQRDAIIARLRIVARDSVRAVAVVTSQVSSVKPTHVLLVLRPEQPWWHRGLFWTGAGVGAAIGAGTAALVR